MSKPVIAVAPQDTIARAAALMREHDIGALAVVDGRRAVGIVTDRDLVTRVLPEFPAAGNPAVADAMSPDPIACHEEQTAEQAAAIMGDEQIRRLLVVDRAGQLVGIISVGDIAENVSEELAGQALGEITETR